MNKIYSNKIESIQLLRGLAALAVVFFHTLIKSFVPFSEIGFESIVIMTLKSLAHFGVDIFFVISGFIMGVIISETNVGGLRAMIRFLVLRIFRIYPLYWITLAAALLIPLYLINILSVDKNSIEISQIILYQYSPLNPVSWTLVYEVRFYLIAALAILCGLKASVFLLSWAILQIIWVILTTFELLPAIDTFSDALSLEFILGLGITYVFKYKNLPFPRLVAFFALIASVPLLPYFSDILRGIENGWPRFFGSGIPAALIVASAISWNRAGIKTPRIFIFLGNISYSIYMWHWILFMFTMTWFGSIKDTHLGFHFFLFAEIGITIAVSFLSYRLIEIPFINYSHLLNKKYLK